MPHEFDMSFESPASVEQVHLAFSNEDYWLARVQSVGRGVKLDSLTVDADGTAKVATSQDLREDGLPRIIAAFYRRDLSIVGNEVWRPIGDGRVSGEISVAAVGAPGSGRGTALLEPLGTGSQLKLSAAVEFKVPLIGSRLEKRVAQLFAEGLIAIQCFTTEWITERS